jgi:endonuclease-3
MSARPRTHLKVAFDVDVAFARLRKAVAPYPRPVLFALADEGYGSPFEIAVACILTIRTLEEVSLPAARRLFAVAHTPAALAALTPAAIDALIDTCTFHEPKSRSIHAIATRVAAEFGGELPCDLATVLSLPGVGPKCAALALGIGCGEAHLPVDIHVHRIANRWGIVSAKTPEKTQRALMEVLPRERWLEINELLVPFGKHVCTGTAPRCSTCPLLAMCQQVGVTRHR